MRIILFALILLTASGCVSAPAGQTGGAGPAAIESKPAKTDLSELVAHYLIYYIDAKAGLRLERIRAEKSKTIELAAEKSKKEESVFLRVGKFRIFSEDALLKPLEADLTLEVRALDKDGAEIYRKIVDGHHANQNAFAVLEESADDLAKGAVKDALMRLDEDPELKKIIAKYKYGTLGAIASIF
ncbi:MAG TPA: hypothetical protein PLO78_05205 [Candidatus Omnitrophota bacterium]|nr:hypothetical protein [Candidatus Omnitrophota bacterium]